MSSFLRAASLSLLFVPLAACGADSSTGSGGARATGASTGVGLSTSASTGATSSSGTGGGTSGRWVTAYYVGYQSTLYPPDAIDWNSLTHLVVGPVTPNSDGTLDTTFDLGPASGPALAHDLVSRAHGAGKKITFMLGGAGSHDAWVGATSAGTRAAFVQNLVALSTSFGVDGFDLDWEPLDPADYASFQALAQDLRAALPGVILTVPVGWVSSNSPTVDGYYGTIAPLFDQINIMTYGMAGPWPDWQSWHSSAIYGESAFTPTSVDSSVKAYLAAGVPPTKLGIGVGFYGSCWTPPVSGPKEQLGGSTIAADDNVMSYTNIMTLYYTAQAHQFDATAKASYLSFSGPQGPQGCQFVSYEDEQSIAEKGNYVKAQGLGGAIVWTINQGYLPNAPAGMQNPVLDALAAGVLH